MKYGLIVALFLALMFTRAFKLQAVKADITNIGHLIEGK